MKGRMGGVGHPLIKSFFSPTLPQYASPYEGEEGWSWASLNKMLHFFLQLFPNPSLHKGREKSNSSTTLPFIREGRLHTACNTKRGCYCGENWYNQLNHHFPNTPPLMKGRMGGVGHPLMKCFNFFSNSSPTLPFIREGRNPTLPQPFPS